MIVGSQATLMTEAVQLALINNIPSICAATAATLGAYFAYRTHGVAKKTEENTNHLKDELVEEVRKASYAAGLKQQADQTAKMEGSYNAGVRDTKQENQPK